MRFGLCEGLCLDIRNLASSKTSAPVFESTEAKAAAAIQEVVVLQEEASSQSAEIEQEDESVTPIVYGQSVASVDFAALAGAGGNCADIDAYVSTLTPSSQNVYTGLFEGKNLILICAEAFSGFLIDPELTPTLYRLSTTVTTLFMTGMRLIQSWATVGDIWEWEMALRILSVLYGRQAIWN